MSEEWMDWGEAWADLTLEECEDCGGTGTCIVELKPYISSGPTEHLAPCACLTTDGPIGYNPHDCL